MTQRVLVIDDEAGVREALKQVLAYERWEVRTAASGGAGIKACAEFQPHVVLLDVKMAGLDGLDTLSQLRELIPATPVVMISGHGTITTAVQATQRGAFDFIEKPLDTDRLLVVLRNAMERSALAGENRELKRALDTRFPMVGTSEALEEVRTLIARVGPSNARVLIFGENGSGKELVARALHEASPRRDRAFVELNCAAIPSELIESELFGHVKGSFTGAVSDRVGKFELADGGTLFLDEIGDMSLASQAKVLRVLQEGVVTRIGSGTTQQVDVRVLAATNHDLEDSILLGTFREDLYFRLNVVPITVPPLRDRLQDIPALVAHFVSTLSASAAVADRPFTDDAIKALQARPWPGNVRELRNAVERLLILGTKKEIGVKDVNRLLPTGYGGGPADMVPVAQRTGTFDAFVESMEKAFLIQRLRDHGWSVSETAKALAMPRSNLYKRIEKYGITREEP